MADIISSFMRKMERGIEGFKYIANPETRACAMDYLRGDKEALARDTENLRELAEDGMVSKRSVQICEQLLNNLSKALGE